MKDCNNEINKNNVIMSENSDIIGENNDKQEVITEELMRIIIK